VAVNGFDNRFTYGFEDGDFGNRLALLGIRPITARWTANVLHLHHPKPWSNPEVRERNRVLMDANEARGDYRARDVLGQVESGNSS
jgi:GT2 family glycosyltransferase